MYNVNKKDLKLIAALACVKIGDYSRNDERVFFWSAGGHLYAGVRSQGVCLRVRLADASGIPPQSVNNWALRQAIRLTPGVDTVDLEFVGREINTDGTPIFVTAVELHPGGSSMTATLEREVPPLIAAQIAWTNPVRHGAEIIPALKEVAPLAATKRYLFDYSVSLVRCDDKGTLVVAGDGSIFGVCEFPGMSGSSDDIHVDPIASKFVLPEIDNDFVFASQCDIVAIETDRIAFRGKPQYRSEPYPDVRHLTERHCPIVVTISSSDLLDAAKAVQSAYAPQRHTNIAEFLSLELTPDSAIVTTGNNATLKISRSIRAEVAGLNSAIKWTCTATNLVAALKFLQAKTVNMGFSDSQRAGIIRPVESTTVYTRTALVAAIRQKK